MKLFSQRKGFKALKNVIQIESMDTDLRNSLWNALTMCYWEELKKNVYDREIIRLFRKLWNDYFKRPIDTLKSYPLDIVSEIREYFFRCKWFEVYDFIEFIANNFVDKYRTRLNSDFRNICNYILEREISAYRFVGGKITQITSEEEIGEIEEALEAGKSLKSVRTHLNTALDLLANRKSPDYRNSIKESISAVEAICRLITGKDKAMLGEALKEIEKAVEIHPSLKGAFSKLYGYSSDAEGIRHALSEESNLDFEDAKFMLVSCSAFINYLVSKSSKAGIKL